MKTLVIYDSVFGNTEKVGQAMGAALEAHGEVTVRRVGEVQPEDLTGLDALIVGSPTRAFSPTPDTKTWLKSLTRGSLQSVKVAAFDTRMDTDKVDSGVLNVMVKVFGYAAKPIADRLTKKGGVLTMEPEGFFVEGTEGPLTDGELERAAAWAQRIAI